MNHMIDNQHVQSYEILNNPKNMKKIKRYNYSNYEIWVSHDLVDYTEALEIMQDCVTRIAKNLVKPTLWLLQHQEVYTAGRLTGENDFPPHLSDKIISIDRGGKLTYHGPGQLVGYAIIPLKNEKRDIREFIQGLECYILNILQEAGIQEAQACREKVGIWVKNINNSSQSEKIASIGIKVRNWITSHGFALNIAPQLEKFDVIVPCGLANAKVTSIKNFNPSVKESYVIDSALKHAHNFLSRFI